MNDGEACDLPGHMLVPSRNAPPHPCFWIFRLLLPIPAVLWLIPNAYATDKSSCLQKGNIHLPAGKMGGYQANTGQAGSASDDSVSKAPFAEMIDGRETSEQGGRQGRGAA